MKDLGLTQETLAKKLGITRGAVTHYLSGRRVPPLKQFQKLSSVLKVDPAWLQFGTTAAATDSRKKKDTAKQKSKTAIPIASWKQVAELGKIKIEDSNEFIPHFYTDKKDWYALRVKGDAMTSPHSRTSFQEGDIIVIDPDQTPVHGSYVIALLPKSKEATFKQYVIDGGVKYLKPLNPQYPITQINDSTFICGVIVSCINTYQ